VIGLKEIARSDFAFPWGGDRLEFDLELSSA
jgi:hypothetical protein